MIDPTKMDYPHNLVQWMEMDPSRIVNLPIFFGKLQILMLTVFTLVIHQSKSAFDCTF